MKILSKEKDYYDYLQGIYGVDEKFILKRDNTYRKRISFNEGAKATFYIGDIILESIYIDGKLLFTEEEVLNYYVPCKVPSCKEEIQNTGKHTFFLKDEYSYRNSKVFRKSQITIKFGPYKNTNKKDFTIIEDCPLLLVVDRDYYNQEPDVYKYPILNDYGIVKHIPPEEVWHSLYNWLSLRITRNEPIVPVGDDKVRIKAAGFDLKTSFRPKIKKK